MARGLQIVQWTIAAQPGHPVFLDVLWRIVRRWEEEGAKTIRAINVNMEKDSNDAVLEWTGPGPWSDAVIRYVAISLTPNTSICKDRLLLHNCIVMLARCLSGTY